MKNKQERPKRQKVRRLLSEGRRFDIQLYQRVLLGNTMNVAVSTAVDHVVGSQCWILVPSEVFSFELLK